MARKVQPDLTGTRIGMLTVLGRGENDKWGSHHYDCQCDCGKKTQVAAQNLRKGDYISCGCLKAGPDLTEQTFNRLTAVERDLSGKKLASWKCQCSCGQIVIVDGCRLLSGNTKSCGCLKVDTLAARNIKHGFAGKTARTSTYNAWKNMNGRCSDRNRPDWIDYGGRGISVAPEWRHDYPRFLADMGESPGRGYSLERLSVDGNYSSENCVWATATQQARNKRNNHRVEYKGETKTLMEWSEITQIPYCTLKMRIYAKWDLDRAMNEPVQVKHRKNNKLEG